MECCCSWIFGNVKYNKEKLSGFSPRSRQVYIASGPFLIAICLGMVQGYSAVLLPELEKQKLFDKNDISLKSWIASIAVLPIPFTCYLGCILMDIIGRKNIHVMCSILCLAGWIVLYFSSTTTFVLVGRFITGSCVGLVSIPTYTYISETTEPKLRKTILTSVYFATLVGIALSHLLGTLLRWQTTALISCIFPLLALMVMTMVPESPVYLAKKLKKDEATDAFNWCRGRTENTEIEIMELLQQHSTISVTETTTQSSTSTSSDLTSEFCKNLVLMIVFVSVSQWSGNAAITYYNIMILEKTLGGQLDDYYSMLLLDLVRLLGYPAALYLLRKMKSRSITLISCAGCALSLFSVSSWMYFTTIYPHIAVHNYLILIALLFYMTFQTMSLANVEFVMIEELFALNNKVLGSRLTAIVNFCFMFTVVKNTPWLLRKNGAEVMFSIFGGVAVLGFGIGWKFLPKKEHKSIVGNRVTIVNGVS